MSEIGAYKTKTRFFELLRRVDEEGAFRDYDPFRKGEVV